MDDVPLQYTGLDILKALEAAENYNSLLLRLVTRGAGENLSALDFGAGIGTFSKLLRNKGFDVSCVEQDEHLARKLTGTGFHTLTTLDTIDNESLAYVFSLNVFEHIADDRSVLRALAQKLKRGGRLLIYVPAFERLRTTLDDKVGHHRRYTKSSLRQLAQSAGLRVLESRYVDCLGYAAALVFKVLGNRQGDLSPAAIRIYDRYVIPVSRRLDYFSGTLFGKNVYVFCRKP